MICQVFDLLTVYVQKGLNKGQDAMVSFRRDLRGLLVDQLTRNRERNDLKLGRLLQSMTETWYALGEVMVAGKFHPLGPISE